MLRGWERRFPPDAAARFPVPPAVASRQSSNVRTPIKSSAACRLGRRIVTIAALVLAISRPSSAQSPAPDHRSPPSDQSEKLNSPWAVPAGRDLVIAVPGDAPDLTQALAAIAHWTIPSSASVTLSLGPGLHPQAGTVKVHHPCGTRVRIVGAQDSSAPTILAWASPVDGIYVGQTHVLGRLDRVRIEHRRLESRGSGSGVIADEGGHIHCGAAVTVVGFYYGFTARRGATLRCPGTRVERAGDAGYFAYMGGHIDAPESSALNASDSAHRLGSGFVAEYNGTIDGEKAVASGCFLAGFHALSGGAILAHRSVARGNAGNGYQVRDGGVIVAHAAAAIENAGFGVSNPFGNGVFTGNDFENHGNQAGATCGVAPGNAGNP
jgi:hypothetical protein